MTIPEFNPNITNTIEYNRGKDTQSSANAEEPISIGLHTIDNAVLKYIQNTIEPTITQDGKMVKVPIVYGNPERWKSIQKDGILRDHNGKIQLPIMMLRRTDMQKNTLSSPVNKYQSYLFKLGWNSRNVYDRFAVVNRMQPSEMYHSTLVPDYYTMTYTALIWTEYMEQMNKIVENISFEDDEYWGEENNYKFVSKITNYSLETELPATQDRMIRSRFNIEVKGYILPPSSINRQGNREKTTRLVYSPKRVVFNTEIVSNPKR